MNSRNAQGVEGGRSEQHIRLQAAMCALEAARITKTRLPYRHTIDATFSLPPAPGSSSSGMYSNGSIYSFMRRVVPEGYVSTEDAVTANVPIRSTFLVFSRVYLASKSSRENLLQQGYDESWEGEVVQVIRLEDYTSGDARWIGCEILYALPYKLKLHEAVYLAFANKHEEKGLIGAQPLDYSSITGRMVEQPAEGSSERVTTAAHADPRASSMQTDNGNSSQRSLVDVGTDSTEDATGATGNSATDTDRGVEEGGDQSANAVQKAPKASSLKRKRVAARAKKQDPSVCCPVPDCTHPLRPHARNTHVFDHLQDDHHIQFTRHKSKNGGNMDDMRKLQDREIRVCLRGQGLATNSRFFKWTDSGVPIVHNDEDQDTKQDVEEEGEAAAPSAPTQHSQSGSSSRLHRQSRPAASSYQDEIIKLNPDFSIPFQIGLEQQSKEMTVTQLLDVGPHLEAMGRVDNIREVIAGVLSQSAGSKKPNGPAPASLLTSLSESEYMKKVLDGSEGSDDEEQAVAIQAPVRTPAAPKLDEDEATDEEATDEEATAATAAAAKPARAARLVCPVPGCAQLANYKISRRLRILNHLRKDHGIHIPQLGGLGGIITGIQKTQEDAIRTWLRGQSMATNSAFFITA
ncbi:hypothetical protein LTR65_003005 [Meristemomyces frigidus]